MKRLIRWSALLIALVAGMPLQAEDILMARSRQPFAETMLTLQEAIGDQGYTVSRVQRVDIGLTEFGYQTDKYRVVFFAKPDELRSLVDKHPEIIPYLPIKIAIFAENVETLLVASNPAQLSRAYGDAELDAVFARWEADLRAILAKVRAAE